MTRTAAVLLAVLTFGLGLHVALAKPSRPTGDERPHAAYAIEVAHGHLPTITTPIPAGWPGLRAGRTAAHRTIWTANHPPLFYLAGAPAVWLGEATGHPGVTYLGLRALNALGMAIALWLLGLIAGELLPHRRWVGPVTIALGLSCGVTTYLGGFIYNDGWACASAFAVLLIGIRMVRTGPTTGQVGLAAGLAVVAAATRSTGLVAVACTCLAAFAAGLITRQARRGLLAAAAIGLAPAVAVGWFYLRNLHLYGDLAGQHALMTKFHRAPTGSTLGELGSPGFYRHLIGSLWTDGRVPDHWLPVGLAIAAAGALGLVLTAARSGRAAPPGDPRLDVPALAAWGVVALFALANLVSVAGFVAGGGGIHSRYALPLLPLGAPLVALGLIELTAAVLRHRRAAIAADLALLLAVALATHVDTLAHL